MSPYNETISDVIISNINEDNLKDYYNDIDIYVNRCINDIYNFIRYSDSESAHVFNYDIDTINVYDYKSVINQLFNKRVNTHIDIEYLFMCLIIHDTQLWIS
jgi:hypothetical protein